MIEIEGLIHRYSAEKKAASSKAPVLDIERLSIPQGETVFLYGPSGSGKTTLLEILSGLQAVQSGQVTVAGQNLVGLTETQRDRWRALHVGYIFQNFNLIPYLSVLENILLPLQMRAHYGDRQNEKIKEKHEQIQNLAKKIGLENFLNRKVNQLSVGQQQRVAALRAVIGEPQILFADEPTSALDQQYQEKFIQILFDFCKKQKTTLVFVSHDHRLKSLFDRSISLLDLNRSKPEANL